MVFADINFKIKQLPVSSKILVNNKLEILNILCTLVRTKFTLNAMFYPDDSILISSALKVDEKTNQLILGAAPIRR